MQIVCARSWLVDDRLKVFWVLWLIDLILPALLGRILWSLVKRRLFPYPTLAQLRERRAEVERAEKFGDRISYRLASTSKFGVKDAWKIAKDFRSRSNVNLASKSKDPAPDESANEQNAKEERVKIAEEEWVLEDLQRILLRFVNEVADLHERVRKWVI
jgi:GRAM domain-containing protein 4